MPAMETLRETFFEDPLYVYVALGIAELVLAAVWWERRTRRAAMLLAAPLLLGAAVYLVAAAVVTDRERIIAAAREIARDVEQGRTDAVERYIDDAFRGPYEGREVDKVRAVAAVRAVRSLYGITAISLRRLEVQVSGGSARMHAVTWLTFQSAALGGGTASLVWDLVWIKRNGQWRILELERVQQKAEL